MKVISALLASGLFILSLVVIYYIHINFFKVDVVFYAAIFDAILAAIAAGFLLWIFPYFKLLGDFEKFQLIAIWLLIGYCLAISVPTVIDRSLSFYILEKIQQRGGGIRQDAFEKVFTQEYVKEHRLVDVRLTEQMQSGTIEIKDGCVLLTSKGEMIAGLSRKFRQNWLPKQRLLLGEYTDALTDPFRSSIATVDYMCEH
ncbi:MAG: hypothetical protein HWE12_10500 [Oceanospirillaceae bacterium]|nr:hypothetical protein [Oceanospirillaceae bacterium]